MNAGSLFRAANAFGASFVFTINTNYRLRKGEKADTSHASRSVPLYEWATVDDLVLPRKCALVGVELLDEATELPRYRHPAAAAYMLGPERGALSPQLLARCHDVIKIPTKFCINVGMAGALVMYDRLLSSTRFGERPVVPQARALRPDLNEWESPGEGPRH